MKYILKRAEIEATEGLAKTHFLNPSGQRINKSLGDIVGLKNLGFHIIEVAPGYESTEYHVHHFEDECVYILSGTATVTIDEVEHRVGPGDFIGYPAGGLAHTMKNTGDELLRCIVVGQRLSHEVSDFPRLNKRCYHNGGAIDLVDHDAIAHPVVGRKI